jgi:hypothetical protein
MRGAPPVPRPRTYSPPPLGWQWRPSIVMKDKAPAANHSVAELFQPELVGMCFAHVYMWFDRNKGLFRNWKENAPLVKAGMKQLNEAFSESELSKVALRELLQQWSGDYGEAKMASAFEKVWGAEVFTRAGMNASFVGGVPSDNNALEAKNGALKRDVRHKRHGTAAFIKVIKQWLERESLIDSEFGETYSSIVFNFNTFKTVYDLVEAACGPFQCKLRFNGIYIIPSIKTIEEAVVVFDCERDAVALKGFFRAQGEDGTDSWISTYLKLHKQPVEYVAARKKADELWDFDTLVMWCEAFNSMKDLPDGQFKIEQVMRLRNGKCGIDEGRILAKDGLCSCNCSRYMHYVVCEHVLADAMLKGSVTAYPPNFDPRNFGGRVGRPPKAVADTQHGKV